jgi:hypothetical protein
MLFNRNVLKKDVIISAFLAVLFAIAGGVFNVIVYVQSASGSIAKDYFMSDLLLSIGVLADALVLAIAFLRNDKNTAFIATMVGMPLYGGAVLFANVDRFSDGTYAALDFWPLGLALIEYMVVAVCILEAFGYVLVHLIKKKASPKFSPAQNTEAASIILLFVAVLWIIPAFKQSSTWGSAELWSTLLGLCGEIALVEAFAGTLYVCDEPTSQKDVSEKEEPAKTDAPKEQATK